MPVPSSKVVSDAFNDIMKEEDQKVKAEVIGLIIDREVNSFSGDRLLPTVFAEIMCETHNTLQSSWIRMLLNTVAAYADLYEKRYGLSYTDRRNEYAVKAAVEIRGLLRDGKLPLPFV